MTKKNTRFLVETGKPIRFEQSVSAATSPPDDNSLSAAIGKTLKAYREAAKNLLKGRYEHLKTVAPPHLRYPCNTTVILCIDGIFVRYDLAENAEPKVRVAEPGKSLSEIAPQFSDFVVHFPPDPTNYTPLCQGPQITFSAHDQHGVKTRDLMTIAPMVFGNTSLPEGMEISAPPTRPICLASLSHEFDIAIGGQLEDASPTSPRKIKEEPTQFVARSRIQLPVGWRAIEVYPLLGKEYWIPEAAPLWAETDLLFSLAQRNAQDSEYKALDSRADLRKKYSELLAQFESLLGGLEEPLHQFIKSNPMLLCPTYDAVWSKVPFGNHVSDFVIREAPNDYVLVEIEAPIRELFRKDGQQRQELTHAIDQINDWLAYIADNRQLVERENSFDGISVNPRALVVIGKSAGLTDENRRKLVTLQERQPRLRILTYDDLLANARLALERIVGPLGIIGSNVEMYYYTPKA